MGGDEFLFWGAGISEEKAEELEETLRLRVREACKDIFPLCGVACGHVVASGEDTSVGEILKRADEKMYENKRGRRF